MIALLLKLGQWITDHPKLFCVGLFLAGGLLGVPAGRRMCATPTIKEEATATTAAIAASTTASVKAEGPSEVTDRRYRSPCKGAPQAPLESRLIEEKVTRTGPILTEMHSERESAQSTTQTLKLEQQGSLAAQWALSVGFENLLHDKTLRLSVRRKLFGPFWAEVAVTPTNRSLGAALAVEW